MGLKPFSLAASGMLLSLVAQPAAAQDADVLFEWERPVGSHCPSRQTLEADVEQAIGRRVFGPAADARVIVRAVVAQDANEVRISFEARSLEGVVLGSRELSAASGDCASLRDAIGLVLTLFVEHGDAAARDSDPIELKWGVGAAVGVYSTPLPRATLAGGPALTLDLGRTLRLRAEAAYWWPVSIQTARGVGAKLEAVSVALRACARLLGVSRVLALRLCAGAELGALIASPKQLDGPDRQLRLLAHGLLELRGELGLGQLGALELGVGPLLSLSRPSLSYLRTDGDNMPVYRPHALGILVQIAVVIPGA